MPVLVDEPLAEEIQTYARLLPTFRASSGKYVLIHGDALISIFDTYGDALRAGYDSFGVARPFLVKQIHQKEVLQQFSRDIGNC